MSPEGLLEVVRATIDGSEYCFLVTQSQAGTPNVRLMQPFSPEEDLTIWLGTSPKSRKVRQIRRDNRTTLAYENAEENAYVVLSGTARIDADAERRKRYWRDEWGAFFPEGPWGSDYTLIEFVPTRIELMNFAREVAPEPYGLKPAVLVRTEQGWVAEYT